LNRKLYMAEHLVVFMPFGKRGHCAEGAPLLQAARNLGVDSDSVCSGRALCARNRSVQLELGGYFR
jgi:uncharacterized 2Fe-2S/4Fe-4S cluster protein (DUF4445 family)